MVLKPNLVFRVRIERPGPPQDAIRAAGAAELEVQFSKDLIRNNDWGNEYVDFAGLFILIIYIDACVKAALFAEIFICQFECPESIQTDHDPQCMS